MYITVFYRKKSKTDTYSNADRWYEGFNDEGNGGPLFIKLKDGSLVKYEPMEIQTVAYNSGHHWIFEELS